MSWRLYFGPAVFESHGELARDRLAGTGEFIAAVKQKGFLPMVFGGPNSYTGKDIRTGNAHPLKMGLDDSHVDAVIEDLGETCGALGILDVVVREHF